MARTNVVYAAIIGVLCASMGVLADDLTDAKFTELHQSLKPKPNEIWRTIPWKISLINAQHAATMEGKPIFIWAMDGHPLGCT